MKIFFFISFLFLLNSCTNNKTVYWCGDHACINKKEKEAYFKKTMIVEKKIINNKVKNEQENNLIQKEWEPGNIEKYLGVITEMTQDFFPSNYNYGLKNKKYKLTPKKLTYEQI